MDETPFEAFKALQRRMWASFAPTAAFTTPVAGHLVAFAGVCAGERVLDVGCGTGVAAVTAARAGARATGLDLTPALLEHARTNREVAGVPEVEFLEGDAEALPFPDASFDVVLSQFGHIFAPRPEVATAEMARVLRPGGRIAFASWPPEHFVGRFFALAARGAQPPPGALPPPLWGSVAVVGERLARHFEPPFFARGVMQVPALSLGHLFQQLAATVGPLQVLVEGLKDDPVALAAVRQDFEALAAPYYAENVVRQDYLLTRARRI